jgi:hypothetical protein
MMLVAGADIFPSGQHPALSQPSIRTQATSVSDHPEQTQSLVVAQPPVISDDPSRPSISIICMVGLVIRVA